MRQIAFFRFFLVVLALAFSLNLAHGQTGTVQADNTDAEAEKSWFLSFVERQLSTPNRQIHISQISGLLSSEATIGSITIADRQGVWLKISDAKLNWNRLELLRGRVSVNELAAKHIDILRKPLPDASVSVPSPEATGFSLPELPVALILQKISADELVFGKDIFGLASTVSLDGGITLAGGELQSKLDVKRLDGGGGFTLIADFSNATRKLKVDLELAEPANGIAANVLNIEGRPALKLAVKGDGSLDNLDMNLTMDAAGQSVLSGILTLRTVDVGHKFDVALNGPIAMLMPQTYRPFFGSDTKLKLDGVAKQSGGMRLDNLSIDGAAIHVNAMAETTSDGFLRNLIVDARLAGQNGKALTLPVSGGNTTIDTMMLTVSYGLPGMDEWVGKLVVNNLATSDFNAGDITLNMGGATENLDDPASRHVAIKARGGVHDIRTQNRDIAAALGHEIDINIDTDWHAGIPFAIKTFDVGANGLALWIKGIIQAQVFTGEIGVKADSLAPFSLLAGRDLAGQTDLILKGDIGLTAGTLDLVIDGKALGIKTGVDIADRLLKTQVTLSGGIGRDSQGIHTRNLKIGNNDVMIGVDGSFASTAADMDFSLSLSDLKLLNPLAGGELQLRGAMRGHNSFITVSARGEVSEGVLSHRKLENTVVTFNGLLDNTSLIRSYFSGKIEGDGRYDGQALLLSAAFANDENGISLDGVRLNLGNAALAGTLLATTAGLMDGKFRFEASDISTLAALALMEGKGSAFADIVLDSQAGKQNVRVTTKAEGVEIANTRIETFDLKAAVSDLFGVPQADGNLNAKNIHAGSVAVTDVAAMSTVENGASHFSVNAKLDNNTRVLLGGALAPQDGGWQLALEQAEMGQGNVHVVLGQPAEITLAGSGKIGIRDLLFKIGAGRLAINGSVDDAIALNIDVTQFPLSIANMIKPDLKLSGTLNGKADISGQRTNPAVAFDIAGAGIHAAPLADNGIAPLAFTAKGTTAGEVLDINARVSGGGGINVGAEGSINIAKQKLDLNIDLANMPLSALNGAAKGQDLAGNVTGTAHVGGSFTKPEATFDIGAKGISAAVLQQNGLAPLALATRGSFGNDAVSVESFDLSGPKGLNVKASGRVPVSGNGLDLKIDGAAPLALGNRFLADRGAQLSGLFNVNATVGGSFAQPRLGGNFSVANGQFIDPETNARLNQITVNGALNGEQITISAISAKSASGGAINGSGTISTNIAAGMPTNITINLDHTRYNDGEMVIATVNGSINVSGPLLRDFVIGGNVLIEKAEISVPDSFGGATQIDVQHKNLTKPIETTLARAKINTKPKSETTVASTRPLMPQLDMQIRAPNQIFVRGRGLDTELGGGIRLTGPVNDVRPVGGFNMIRGRFNILTQRLTFAEGQVTLTGNMNPDLNFVARTDGGDITVTVTVKGTPDALDIQFSSQPELPQDEVLARLLFNRSISELSPFQIAQLAAAAAELAGITNTSLLGSLRSATGLDDLDIVTDAQGNTGVKAGRYIRDNVYLGVEAGSDGDTKGTINLDISRNLKAKGSVGSDANSSVGVFYEKDY